MCKRMDDMAERIRKERNLPEETIIPLGYVCNCDECLKMRPKY